MPKKILNYLDQIDNVVWDWNGTLLNDLTVTHETEAAHFRIYGLTPPTREERKKLFCFPIQTYYERIGFDFTKHDYAAVNTQFMQLYEAKMAQALLFEGTAELLAEIAQRGKKQFILSAAPQAHLEMILGSHKIEHHFHAIYGLPHVHADSKIERGRDLIREHQIDPSRTLMIGDTSHDHEVATALGFQALLIADGHMPYENLKELHHQVLQSRYSQ